MLRQFNDALQNQQYSPLTEMSSMWRLCLFWRVLGHPLGSPLIGAAIYLSTP
jgi:hypothetical protein